MRTRKRVFKFVVATALVLLTLWLLSAFAQWRANQWMRTDAARALALSATGDTPYRWAFHGPQSIIAGRVFGSSDYSFSNNALIVRFGAPFEIGLPLTHAVDLQRFSRLRIDVQSDVAMKIDVVVRQRLDSELLNSEPQSVVAGKHSIEIDLAASAWKSNTASVPAPRAAAMLRLRVQLARDHVFQLHGVTLQRIAGFHRLNLANTPSIVQSELKIPVDAIAVYQLPPRATQADMQAIGQRIDVHSDVLMLLRQDGRIEQQLQQRDRLLDALPAAIVIPQSQLLATFALARAHAGDASSSSVQSTWKWVALGVYVLLLVAVRWNPPTAARWRAMFEVLLALFGPLWLIAGGYFTGSGDVWQSLLIAVIVAYALSFYRTGNWQWNGSIKAWLLAAGVVVIAAAIGVALHRPDSGLRPLDSAHLVRYLGWALIQQYLICTICTQRWRIITGNGAIAVYLGALGFALLHTPNAMLMVMTFCAGLCWCALYLRERALLPLAASHAASALLLMTLLPADILRSAEVSVRFFY